MSGFTYFKRGECPICNGSSKGCRESLQSNLIFCRESSASPNGYVYRGQDKNGFGMWQRSDDAEAFRQMFVEERETRRQEFLAREARRRETQLKNQLSAVERDTWYRKLLNQLKLDDDDHDRLLDRGLTPEQIEKHGYRSVKKFQYIRWGYPENLPGVIKNSFGNGQILNVWDDGIICPIYNHDGLIIGCQVRLNNPTDGGRYRWLSSSTKRNPEGVAPHLDAELPIGTFEPEEFLGDSIWLTEGTSIKPSLTRYRLGVPVIGASSGRFDNSPKATKESLNYLSQKYNTKLLTVAIDAGDVVNQAVINRWYQQFDFLQSLGYKLQIAWWNQLTKDDDDIDELADYSIIKFISVDNFKAIVNEDNSKPEKEEKAPPDWAWEQWLRSRKFTPDIVVNQKEFALPKLPDSGHIIAVKSGLGTGKTLAMLYMLAYMAGLGVGSHLIGYRNNLLFQTIDRGDAFGVKLYHLQKDDGFVLMADDGSNLAYCLDSIHHVDGRFKGRNIILDESCSVLLHAVNGGTLGNNQAKAIKILTKAIQDANNVYLFDGNLSDLFVDFIAILAPNKKVIKIENQQKIPPHQIKIVDAIDVDNEIKKRDKSPLIKMLLDPDIIPWIFCDSKERTKVIGELLQQAGRTGIILNSETCGDNWAKDFLKDANAYIKENKPQFVIVSPTAESGVSVTINNYFTHKFSFFVGVQGTNSQHQAMFRLRDNSILHYVFCPERSTVPDRSTPHNYSVKKYQETINQKILQSGLLATQSANNPQRALEVITNAIARQQDEWWELSCKLGALDNFEQDNLRKCLIHALEEAGHNVELINLKSDEPTNNLEKKAREAVRRLHAQELYTASPFDSIEEAKEKAKSNPRKDTQRRIEKTFLLDKLPKIEESELWGDEFIYELHIKRKDFITQQQRYFLVKNLEMSQKMHESSWFYQATGEDFFSARVKKKSHETIWALKQLDILRFEEIDYYHKNSPEVVEVISLLRQRSDIQLALNINVEPETATGDERLRIIDKLLNYIGLKNGNIGKKNIGNIRSRCYKCQPAIPKIKPATNIEDSFDFAAARLQVLSCIEEKFTKWIQSEKAQIDWNPEPETTTELITEPVTSTIEPINQLVEQLRQITHWSQVILSQQELDDVWQLLELGEQARLSKLWEQYQQELASQPKSETTEIYIQHLIDSKTNVKAKDFGTIHFRSYVIKAVEGCMALVRKCFGDKNNTYIELDKLLIYA